VKLAAVSRDQRVELRCRRGHALQSCASKRASRNRAGPQGIVGSEIAG
jgi:hypothetical protein